MCHVDLRFDHFYSTKPYLVGGHPLSDSLAAHPMDNRRCCTFTGSSQDNTFLTIANCGGVLGRQQYFPYFYVPLPADAYGKEQEFLSCFTENLQSLCHRIREPHMSSNGRRANNDGISSPSTTSTLLHSVRIEYRIPIYGFYTGPMPFIRIAFTRPEYATKLAAALYAGHVLGYQLQPHEVHIPYLLHFLSDYCISGSSLIYLSDAKLRTPLPPRAAFTRPPHFYWKRTLYGATMAPDPAMHESDYVQKLLSARSIYRYVSEGEPVYYTNGLLNAGVTKVSRCEVEMDASVTDIMNPVYHSHERDTIQTDLVGPSVGFQPPVRLTLALRALWEDERRRCMRKGLECPKVVHRKPSVRCTPFARRRDIPSTWPVGTRWLAYMWMNYI